MGRRGATATSSSSSSSGGSSNARELKMFMKNRMWRDHWHVLVAVAGIVVALFASAVLQFSTAKDHVYRLEVTDTALMTRVFQSGEPWTVLCSKPDAIVPEVFTKATKRLADKTFLGVLDCSQRLPASGKTVLGRYGIKSSVSPTIFTVANREKPRQVFLNYLQSPKALARRVVEQTKKTAAEVLNSAHLESKCLQRPTCVLLLRGAKFKTYEKQWLDRLMAEHRTLSFAWVDSTLLKISIESMLPAFHRGEHRVVLFKRQRDAETKKAVITAKAYRNLFELLPLQQFLRENVDRELKALSKMPTLKRRKAAERAKRERQKAPQNSEELGESEAESYAERRRRERQAAEEERGDEYYFPQSVDPDDVQDGPERSDGDEEEVEVLDLDEEAGTGSETD
ncbi:hypothetical protein P43SY_009713 [Pythium insidiosum]|uniref:Transmembrane protein n=1 Tax=Pythium insidiosum TaxID=114742 RepID=A0AAD5QBN9_PYTIN|nr:hypothetical protein P43SY_009713 [Pythium insidiosum]